MAFLTLRGLCSIFICQHPPTGLVLEAFADLKVAGGDLLEGTGRECLFFLAASLGLRHQH